MTKIIELQHYQAVIEGLKALDKFKKDGSRKDFKRWLKKYGKKGG